MVIAEYETRRDREGEKHIHTYNEKEKKRVREQKEGKIISDRWWWM